MFQKLQEWIEGPIGEAVGFVFFVGVMVVVLIFIYAVLEPCWECL